MSDALNDLTQLGGFQLDEFEELLRLTQVGPESELTSSSADGGVYNGTAAYAPDVPFTMAGDLYVATEPWTIFAPTDEALMKAKQQLGGGWEDLEMDELDALLAYHVATEPVTPFQKMASAATLLGPALLLTYGTNQGSDLPASPQHSLKYLTGPQSQDVGVLGFISTPLCSGGYVYVIDTALMP